VPEPDHSPLGQSASMDTIDLIIVSSDTVVLGLRAEDLVVDVGKRSLKASLDAVVDTVVRAESSDVSESEPVRKRIQPVMIATTTTSDRAAIPDPLLRRV